jgi:hypothetical protein
MPNMRTQGQRIRKLLGGKPFLSQGPCDLDLKINKGHLQIMTNINTKYKVCGSKAS